MWFGSRDDKRIILKSKDGQMASCRQQNVEMTLGVRDREALGKQTEGVNVIG